MDYQQQDFSSGNDGFYNTNYEQNYGYDSNQQQQYYEQTSYSQPYAAPQQPQMFSPPTYAEPKVGEPGGASGPGYTNFDDEPPLLEGITSCIIHYKLIIFKL